MPDPYEEALRRLREVEGGTEEEGDGLATLVGRTVLDLNTRFIGIVKTRSDRRTGQQVYWLSGEGGRAQNLNIGATLVDPNTRQVINVDPTGGVESGGKLSEEDIRRLFGGGAGSTYHPPAWKPGELELEQEAAAQRRRELEAEMAAAQRQLDWDKEQFRQAEASADRRQMEMIRADMELQEKRLENSRRELLYTGITSATQTAFQAQEAERGRQQEMAGEDPFRFTATLRGRGVQGQTPTDIFKQQGAAFANQPLPQFSINDPISTLEAGLQGLQKMSTAGAPQGLIPGLAGGGIIEMENKDGAFSIKPAQRETYLVGDGAGIIPGVTEALTVEKGPFGIKSVEVTPLAGMAQGGLDISGLDLGGFPDLLESLRRSRGLQGFLARPGAGGKMFGMGDVLRPGQASTLGAFQRAPGSLLQATTGGPVSVVDESGQLRGFTSGDIFRQSGYDFGDVSFLQPQQLARFERGANIRDEPFSLPLPNYEGAFGALGQPLSVRQGMLELAAVNPNFSEADALALADRIGFLPAPHKIARDFPLLDPSEQQGLISLYELAGFPAGSFQRAIGAATPQAGAFGGRRIGFTGGWT